MPYSITRPLFNFAAFLFLCFAISTSNWNSAQGDDSVFISDEPGLEFSIQIPPLWTVEQNYAGYTALLKPSAKAPRIKLPKGMKADPTITVATSRKPIVVNEAALEENARDIEENFTKTNGRWTDFQIFQKTLVHDLSNGASGLLYYIAYKSDGVEVGQAVLLMGHEQGRFRVTLSDHRLNFDKNLETYYPYMVSLAFKSPPPSSESKIPYDYIMWGLSVVIVGVLIGLRARHKRERKSSRSQWSSRSRSGENSELSIPLESVISEAPRSEQSVYPSQAPVERELSEPVDETSSFPEPAFTASDLSSPPQSIPLSQVVDESSAPPSVRKRWSTMLGMKSGGVDKAQRKSDDDDI